MLKARDFRQRAWSSLTGKWGAMVLITLIVTAIEAALDGLSIIGVGAIALIIVMGPLELGVAMCNLNTVDGTNVEVGDAFKGFNNFTNAFLLSLLTKIFTFLWTLLFIIPGIIKSYAYRLGVYILADNPAMDGNAARIASMDMMKGNKWRLFCLDFSFIGWYLLGIITCGILLFWVVPYHNCAVAAFYRDLCAQRGLNGYSQSGAAPSEDATKTADDAADAADKKTEDPFEDLSAGADTAEKQVNTDNGNSGDEPPLNADDL